MDTWSEDSTSVGGFQGRLNKVADTCYTFWVLGTLQVLDRGNRNRIQNQNDQNQNEKNQDDKNQNQDQGQENENECSSNGDNSSGGSGVGGSGSWLEMYDSKAIRYFLLDEDTGTQDTKRGGFGKIPDAMPDILHSYYGVCGLALIGNVEDGVLALDATLSISERSRNRLKVIQETHGWL